MADTNTAYLKLITSEHANQQNYNQYVRAFLDMVSPIVDVYTDFVNLFNINTAVGNQLDIIGYLVGVSRKLPVVDPRIPPILTDTLYRRVINAKILQNQWDGTYGGLRKILASLYPDNPVEITDNQDMTMQITIIDPKMSDEDKALIQNGFIIPKPSGVGITYTIKDDALFGWESDTAFIKGWEHGIWN